MKYIWNGKKSSHLWNHQSLRDSPGQLQNCWTILTPIFGCRASITAASAWYGLATPFFSLGSNGSLNFARCWWVLWRKNMKKHYNWLVVEPPTPLKNHGVQVSWDDYYYSILFPISSPPVDGCFTWKKQWKNTSWLEEWWGCSPYGSDDLEGVGVRSTRIPPRDLQLWPRFGGQITDS